MRTQPGPSDPKPVDKPNPLAANPFGGPTAEQDEQNPPPAR